MKDNFSRLLGCYHLPQRKMLAMQTLNIILHHYRRVVGIVILWTLHCSLMIPIKRLMEMQPLHQKEVKSHSREKVSKLQRTIVTIISYVSNLALVHNNLFFSSPPTILTVSNVQGFIYYIVYALVNAIMCVPCLYGYASVVFAHDVYQSHVNALSKLVIFSSLVHQCCFSIFSTLPFAIGQVQDAGEHTLQFKRK